MEHRGYESLVAIWTSLTQSLGGQIRKRLWPPPLPRCYAERAVAPLLLTQKGI